MKIILSFLSIYFIIFTLIFTFYTSVTNENQKQIQTINLELKGLQYLKALNKFTKSITSNVNKSDINSNIENILSLQSKHPKFKNDFLNKYLENIKNATITKKESYDFLDFINHENYRISDISMLLFEEDREKYFLASLISHYLPEYLISLAISNNIVKKFSDNGFLSEYDKNLYTEQNSLVYLSSKEITSILTLLSQYKSAKKISLLNSKITNLLSKLSIHKKTLLDWEVDTLSISKYLEISNIILRYSQELNDSTIEILEKNLIMTKIQLEEEVNIHKFLIFFIIVLISLIMFYYYRSYVALEEQKLKTLDALEFKSKFLSNMSHEIRTPLNGIVGLIQVILKTNLKEKQKDIISKIQYSSKILMNVVNDILDISKIESGKMNIEKSSFDLKEIVTNLTSILSIEANSKNITLDVYFEDDICTNVIGDSLRVSQILTNLVSNAIKFTSIGGVSLHIKEKENNIVLFKVIDTGIGLKPEQIGILFQDFIQADMSTSRKYGGTGLGLCIVENLVELMDGRVWIESTYGKGSTFSFEILLEKERNKIIQHDESKAIKHIIDTVNNLEGIKILVAEDNKMNQMILSMLLEDTKIELDFADDGLIAIDMFQKDTYSLVFTDIQMPNLNGYDTTRRLRELNHNIPIIAISANVMQDDIKKALDSGMNEHLEKPIDTDKLYEVLFKYLFKPYTNYT